MSLLMSLFTPVVAQNEAAAKLAEEGGKEPGKQWLNAKQYEVDFKKGMEGKGPMSVPEVATAVGKSVSATRKVLQGYLTNHGLVRFVEPALGTVQKQRYEWIGDGAD